MTEPFKVLSDPAAWTHALAPLDRVRKLLLEVPADEVEHERQRLAPPFPGETEVCAAPPLLQAIASVMRRQEALARRPVTSSMLPSERLAVFRARKLFEALATLATHVIVERCAEVGHVPVEVNLRRADPDRAVIVETPPPANIILPGAMARNNGSLIRRAR